MINEENKHKMISVILPSCLLLYKGCAKDREKKLVRAVESFIDQTYLNKELIIIADGCNKTEILYEEYFEHFPEIKYKYIDKQPDFSGMVRQEGIDMANGEIICYLDSDDYIGKNHLEMIAMQFKTSIYDWVYYNDYYKVNKKNVIKKQVKLEKGSIGTSSIAHKNFKNTPFENKLNWIGCNEYNHDWLFVSKLIVNCPKRCKISGTEYNICHIPDQFDY